MTKPARAAKARSTAAISSRHPSTSEGYGYFGATFASRARSAAAELAKMTTDEKNAALLAIQMLSIENEELSRKLDESRVAMAEQVMAKNQKING